MHAFLITLPLVAAAWLNAAEQDWTPRKDEARARELAVPGRVTEVFRHGTRAEWGYQAPQEDTFIVLHPRQERRKAPLYVVLHSAGHDVVSCLKCTSTVGNHDIYHAPDDHYALYLDCRANRGDWWWGGMHAKDAGLVARNSGGGPVPVERRVIDTVKWVMAAYEIDADRVYLCGNSMGGSGTLGIGLRHGDLFAAIKANVPAGIEHAADRMWFPPKSVPAGTVLPDPPVVVDYSAPNDGWSFGHERMVAAMNERKYAYYFYWGPFGHANNHAAILAVNDLVNSFDWLGVRRNEAYAVFTNASSNDPIPWPDRLAEKAPGQINAFFRWKTLSDARDRVEMALYLVTARDLKTSFAIPAAATADVSLRRLQNLQLKPGDEVSWSFAASRGRAKADAEGVLTIPGLRITGEQATLAIDR